MNKQKFLHIYNFLPPKQKETLHNYLAGLTDEENAEKRGTCSSTIRTHLASVARAFGLTTSLRGCAYRDRLVDLFVRYKPDLVCRELRESIGYPTPVPNEPMYEGPLPLDSKYYVERSDCDEDCYEHIQQPGSLIRIKATKQLGKTSLLNRIVNYAQTLNYQTVTLSFASWNMVTLKNIDQFLKYFCSAVSNGLRIEQHIHEEWDDLLTANANCQYYFENHILNQNKTIVLALDDLDKVFENPETSYDFCALLRDCHNEAKRQNINSDLWKNIKFILAHSTEVYTNLSIAGSPLTGVGKVFVLNDFNFEQLENLMDKYRLNWNIDSIKNILEFLGGNPYLHQLAFAYIYNHKITLEEFFQESTSESGIYGEHLLNHLKNLRQNNDLSTAFCQVAKADKNQCIQIDPIQAESLERLGLVRREGNYVRIRCQLYRQYFNYRLCN